MLQVQVGYYLTNNDAFNVNLQSKPEKCPHCHVDIDAKFKMAFFKGFEVNEKKDIEAIYVCPRTKCAKLFIAYYELNDGIKYILKDVSIGKLFETEKHDDLIKKVSPNFVEIYNQADFAEQMKFNQITGISYRKALEFLIKDYVIYMNPEDSDKIKKISLKVCIDEYINTEKIQKLSTAAHWLGNDEAHYLKKWETKDIEDLKKLIRTCCRYIAYELHADETFNDMKLNPINTQPDNIVNN